MRKILYIVVLMILCSCTKENYIDTGVSNSKHDCTMFEFLQQDSYNWDSTVLVIKRADLVHVFDGTDNNYKQITFFGPNNHSIRRFMIDNKYPTVNDIPVDICRTLMMKHVVGKKYMKEDIPLTVLNITGDIIGGIILTAGGGNQLHAYNIQDSYGGVAGAGPIKLNLRSIDQKRVVPMATPNLETNTGVVHALNGDYTFGNL